LHDYGNEIASKERDILEEEENEERSEFWK
jgi:hypothetical protein